MPNTSLEEDGVRRSCVITAKVQAKSVKPAKTELSTASARNLTRFYAVNAEGQATMSDYRNSAPMKFGPKPGEKITDMDWEVAVGVRCPECYTKLDAENHCPNPHHSESDATGYVEPTHVTPADVDVRDCLANKGRCDAAVGWFDGGSSKNPGPGAYAWAIETADKVTYTGMRPLGVTTNNIAEYSGLIALLERVRELGIKKIEIRGDSQLVIEQMKGTWKVKSKELKELNAKAKALLDGLDVTFIWIAREENERCDAAVKFAIKESKKAVAT